MSEHLPRRQALLLGAASLLSACASPPPPSAHPEGWHEFALPGKRRNRYRSVVKEGRTAFEAVSDHSASLWRRRLSIPAARVGPVSFSWWVEGLLAESDVSDSAREDAVARVIFGFDGDHRRLSGATRAQFELAELLTGETPPYATLMYVWERRAPVEAVITNPRSDRIRKIVLDTGASQLGRWRDHRRHLAQDFERAFGEPPGDLVSVAFMTDSDNTRGRARSWYGPLSFG
ncbi:DUF3047 domain-containing protein [Inhella sp.]|uniref:DUF3047 domain-containing protein n=1 Tax=Inhella sp. TaxID=1921806 RepID=UPI0035B2039B